MPTIPGANRLSRPRDHTKANASAVRRSFAYSTIPAGSAFGATQQQQRKRQRRQDAKQSRREQREPPKFAKPLTAREPVGVLACRRSQGTARELVKPPGAETSRRRHAALHCIRCVVGCVCVQCGRVASATIRAPGPGATITTAAPHSWLPNLGRLSSHSSLLVRLFLPSLRCSPCAVSVKPLRFD